MRSSPSLDGRQDRFDPVVGADGQHSQVRTLAFGPEAQFERFLDCYVAASMDASDDVYVDRLSQIHLPRWTFAVRKTHGTTAHPSAWLHHDFTLPVYPMG